MYKIYLDGKILYNSMIRDLKILEPKVELEQNAFGSFDFIIYKTNRYYNDIKRHKSIIEVYQNGKLIFYGRPVEIDKDYINAKKVSCEGCKAYLCDSIQKPYIWQEDVKGLLEYYIAQHNAQVEEEQRFTVGEVTVTDDNDYIYRSDSQYLTTWESIKEKLLKPLGGYIRVRIENGIKYIDYLKDYTTLNNQKIEFGKNMLTVNRNISTVGIATVIIPLGAKDEETGERVTIESVNDGKDYLEDVEAIKAYRRVVKTVIYDDVTEPYNLMQKGLKDLADYVTIIESIVIDSVDMASVKKDISSFSIYSKIGVKSKFHGLDEYLIPQKISIYLFEPQKNKITLNATRKSLTDDLNDSDSKFDGLFDIIENIEHNYNVNLPNQIIELKKELNSIIEQTATEIRFDVNETIKDEKGNILSEVGTQFEQDKNSFEMKFTQLQNDIDGVLNDTNGNFEEIRKFIRFEDGNIILGEVNNDFYLKITKDRISFFEGEHEIAYMSNSKLYTTALEVIHSLQIGAFIWLPRKNGNLTFKKMNAEALKWRTAQH